jgi:hypothetical protein
LKKIKIMNNTLLNTTRFSTAASIPLFSLIAYIYLAPIVSLIGFIFNIGCIIVLAHPKLSGDSYKYLIFKTLVHLVVLATTTGLPISNCATCPVSQTLFGIIYRIYVLSFFSNAMNTCATLIEIVLSYDRLLLLKQRTKYLKKLSVKYSLGIVVLVGIGLNLPYLLLFRIEVRENGTRVVGIGIVSLEAVNFYFIFLNIFQSLVSFIILAILNTLVTIEFRKYMNKKNKLLSSKNKSNQMEPRKTIAIEENKETSNFQYRLSLSTTKMHEMRRSSRINSKYPLEHLVQNRKPTVISQISKTILKNEESKRNSADKKFTMMIIISSLFYSVTRFALFISIFYSQLLQLIRVNSSLTGTIGSMLSYLAYLLTIIYFGSNFFIYISFNKMFRMSLKKILHIQ